MKKYILITFILVSFSSIACEMYFDKTDIKFEKGKIVTLVGKIKFEHRKCVLDDDDVNIDYNKIEKISETGWKKIKRKVLENTITFKMLEEGGSIRAWRECSKKGISEVILKFK